MTDPTPETTPMRDEAAWLPCPFCGGRAMRAPSVSSYDATEVDGCRIKCASDGCPVDGKSFYGEAAYDQAAAWWNRRASASGGVVAGTVRALEWRMAKPDGEDRTAYAEAVTGDYTAFAFRSLSSTKHMVYGWQRRNGEDVRADSFEAAKAAAQADYEARIRSALSPAATPVSEAEPVAFPADGELLNMEDGERANEFWRWAKAAALPLHMAESGLNRFHEDDRTEWAWQAWCAALAKPASSPAGGDVRRKALDLIEAVESTFELDHRPALRDRVDGLRAALSQSTSPEEKPTASGETVGSFRDRGPVATNPPGRGEPGRNSTSGEVGE